MIDIPKFLIFRFAPGSAGNMLASILQCSPEVCHWDPQQQSQKPNNSWHKYFQQVFTNDLSRWVYNEPSGRLKWGTKEIFSARFSRGNKISLIDFLKLEQSECNLYYHQQRKTNRYLPIFWHKEIMPEYFKNSRSVIIRLDKASLRWFDHAVFTKHFKIVSTANKTIKIHLLDHRPDTIPKTFKGKVEDFEKEWPSFRKFVKEKILENPYRMQYQFPDRMPTWSIPTISVDLSSLLDQKKIYATYLDCCVFLRLTPSLSQTVLLDLHKYWRDLHAF